MIKFNSKETIGSSITSAKKIEKAFRTLSKNIKIARGMKCKVKSRSILVILVNLKVKYYFISKKWNSTSRNLIERSKRLKLLMKV